jgi:hypothetical protein
MDVAVIYALILIALVIIYEGVGNKPCKGDHIKFKPKNQRPRLKGKKK